MMLSLFYGTLRNISKIKNTDLVICIVPYTISILPAILLSKRKKAKLWIHVQDFEFDLAIDSGIVKNNSLFMKAIKSILSNLLQITSLQSQEELFQILSLVSLFLLLQE